MRVGELVKVRDDEGQHRKMKGMIGKVTFVQSLGEFSTGTSHVRVEFPTGSAKGLETVFRKITRKERLEAEAEADRE